MEATLDSVTYWEEVAEKRLGAYVTDLERALLERALRSAGRVGTALEVGCGGGRWAQIPAARGWQMICTDVDAHSVEVCRQRLPQARCVQVSADEQGFPCDAQSVDMIICYEVEPVTESTWFPHEAFRILKPGGMLVTSFLNSLSLRGLLHKTLRHSAGGAGFYRNSYLRKRRRLRQAGFHVVAEQGCCWLPFSRASDSPLVPVCAQWEHRLGLRSMVWFSPWVLVLAQKPVAPGAER